MAQYVGFQLAVELTRVFPVQDLVHGSVQKVLGLARDLRNSGSDIVVEEDLADVFGRGRVSATLEKAFKDCVRIAKFTPLYHGSEVELHYGPGPTMNRAFQQARYFATVVTLSMLSYFCPKTELATLIGWALEQRSLAKIPGSNGSPGFDGISTTLEACSSQSGGFHWSSLRQQVEDVFLASLPGFCYSGHYCRLSPAVFLGLLDFLYIAQTLPRDRQVTISSETGSFIVIIWAHYILGLTVVVSDPSGGDVVFGDSTEPQVFIIWDQAAIATERKKSYKPLRADFDMLDKIESIFEKEYPTIRLLDKDDVVILACEPEEETAGFSKLVQERHPLRGYGSTYLRRLFNTDVVTHDLDAVYPESIALVSGLAVHAAGKLYRKRREELSLDDQTTDHNISDQSTPPGPMATVEIWRVITAARIMFADHPFHVEKVSSYSDFYAKKPLDKTTLPSTLGKLLTKAQNHFSRAPQAADLIDRLVVLSRLVLLFSHIAELDDCEELPLVIGAPFTGALSRCIPGAYDQDPGALGPGALGPLEPLEIFHKVVLLLDPDLSLEQDLLVDHPWSTTHHRLFLVSNFGWSVFLPTVGESDPGDVRPTLVHVKRGTPTSKKTKERRLRIRDGVTFAPDHLSCLSMSMERAATYEPRATAHMIRRKEYWATKREDFELTIHLTFRTSQELRDVGARAELVETVGFRNMFEQLWQTYSTPECQHHLVSESDNKPEKRISLGPDSAVCLTWLTPPDCPERILIILSWREPSFRWSTVARSPDRKIMLRTSRCCEACALTHVALLDGRWALIL